MIPLGLAAPIGIHREPQEEIRVTHRGLTPDTVVAFLNDIVAGRGAESYLGVPVTIGQHMLQAAHLAEAEGAGEDLVAAALLQVASLLKNAMFPVIASSNPSLRWVRQRLRVSATAV